MTQFTHKLLKYLNKIDRAELEHIVQELDNELNFKDSLLNEIQEGVLITDANMKINFVNEPFLRSFQLNAQDLIHQPISLVFEKFDLNERDLTQSLYQEHQTIRFDFSVDDSPQKWFRFLAVPLKNEANKILGVICSFLEITDLKHLDEKRTFTEKWNTLIPLAAGLAHEIGNPLNAMDIHMQLCLREIENLPSEKKQKLKKCLSVAKEEIDRLDRIVRNFLSAVRPLKGNLSLVNINQVLDSALDLMTPEASQAAIEIERKFQTNVPELLVDPDQIRQAFINLIKNAIQAMPKGGQLKVLTELKENNVAIHFKDQGPGIPKEVIAHIFEPYYSTKDTGSGLGLVAVKRIINNHGGSVRIDEENKKGAHIIVLLPLSQRQKLLLGKGGEKE